MSYSQFTEMVCSAGLATGTPCTIRRLGRLSIEDCPEENMRQVFDKEFKNLCHDTADKCKDLTKRANEILNRPGTIKKDEKVELLDLINKIVSSYSSEAPFIQSQFTEALDKTTVECKGEVEAFISNMIHRLGVEALEDIIKKQLTDSVRDSKTLTVDDEA